MNLTVPGLKRLLISPRPHGDATTVDAIAARALFRAPDSATRKGRDLVGFLAQVSLFADLGRRDLARLARIVHEREYADGEYICEEGRPGAALFIVRAGVVEVVRRNLAGSARGRTHGPCSERGRYHQERRPVPMLPLGAPTFGTRLE